MILKKAENDEPIISGIYLCLSAVAMLICTVSYLFTMVWHAANIQVGTQQANGADS